MSSNKRTIDVLAVIVDVGMYLENSVVLRSQVGEQFLALQSMGIQTALLSFYRNKNKFNEVIGHKMRKAGITCYMLKDRGFFLNVLLMPLYLIRLRLTQNIRSCYVRGLWGSLVILLSSPFKHMNYVYDVRGEITDESLAKGASKYRLTIYRYLESLGIRKAKYVTVVSKYLFEHIFNTYEVTPKYVIPSSVDINKYKFATNNSYCDTNHISRKKDIVFVYSGGLSHYQQVPAMLNLWSRFLCEEDISFLLLTNDDPHSMRLEVGDLTSFGRRLSYISVSSDEVSSILTNSSIGFMLRDSRILNNAASPVKFAEYLAAGLAIVASPSTGDVSYLITKHNIGISVDPNNLDMGELMLKQLVTNLRDNRQSYRDRSRELARAKYYWKSYTNEYYDLYDIY